MFAPESDIHFLANAEVDPTLNNVRDFPDKEAQANYFLGYTKFTFSDCRVLDTVGFSGTFTAPIGNGITIDSYYDCNYIMYRNSGISGKWFYAFIGTPQPLNAGCVVIPYTIDNWQTWSYDVGVDQCFVEREIPADDTVGSNVIPEDVDTGEFVMCPTDLGGKDLVSTITGYSSDPCIVVAFSFAASDEEAATYFVTELTNNLKYEFKGLKPIFSGGYLESGIYQANYYIWVDASVGTNEKIKRINDFISEQVGEGQVDRIRWIKMVPRFLCNGSEYTKETYTSPSNSTYPTTATIAALASPETISGYKPECNKLYTQQFNYTVISNGSGASQEMGYEYFAGHIPKFAFFGMLGDDPSMRLAPVGYKCAPNVKNYMYVLDISGFPSASFSVAGGINSYNADRVQTAAITQNMLRGTQVASEALLGGVARGGQALGNWLRPSTHEAENANGQHRVFGALSQLGKLITDPSGTFNHIGNYAGSLLTGARAVAGSVVDMVAGGDGALPHVRTPNTVSGAAGSDISFAIGQKTFTQFRLQITEPYARKIDSYFKAYGYKTNTIKIPDLSSRPKWNYVKCTTPNVHGNAPYEVKISIAQMLSNGVRVWHPGAKWMDFSQVNK